MHKRVWEATLASVIAVTLAFAQPVAAEDDAANSVSRAENYAESAFDAYSRGDYAAAVQLYRYQVAPWANPDAHGAYVIDTATGELWSTQNGSILQKAGPSWKR